MRMLEIFASIEMLGLLFNILFSALDAVCSRYYPTTPHNRPCPLVILQQTYNMSPSCGGFLLDEFRSPGINVIIVVIMCASVLTK